MKKGVGGKIFIPFIFLILQLETAFNIINSEYERISKNICKSLDIMILTKIFHILN